MTVSYRLHARRARQISQVDESYAQSQPADRFGPCLYVYVCMYMPMSMYICLCLFLYGKGNMQNMSMPMYIFVTFFVRMVFDVMSIRQRMAEPV
jgi:hypothetical protein